MMGVHQKRRAGEEASCSGAHTTMGQGSSWIDQQNKVGGAILDLGLVFGFTIPIGVLNVADGTEPWEEAVRDINGD